MRRTEWKGDARALPSVGREEEVNGPIVQLHLLKKVRVNHFPCCCCSIWVTGVNRRQLGLSTRWLLSHASCTPRCDTSESLPRPSGLSIPFLHSLAANERGLTKLRRAATRGEVDVEARWEALRNTPGKRHATALIPLFVRVSTRFLTWVDLPLLSRPSRTMKAPRRTGAAAIERRLIGVGGRLAGEK